MNKAARFLTSHLLTLAQAAVIGLLAVFLWLVFRYDYGTTVAQDADRRATAAKPLDYSALPASIVSIQRYSDYQVISDRPLFYPTRRKMEAEVEPQAPAPQPQAVSMQGVLTLNGVSITANEKTALLWHQTQRRFYKKKAGESLENWEIAEITPDSVVLKANGQNLELKLRTESHYTN